LDLDGSVKTQGTGISAAIAEDSTLSKEVEGDRNILEAPEAAKATPDGKLVMAEEVIHGHVTWKSMNLLLTSLAGQHPSIFILVCVGGLSIMSIVSTLEPWWLGVWGSQYETRNSSEVDIA